MRRKLRPDEVQLWAKVVETVKPLDNRPRRLPMPPEEVPPPIIHIPPPPLRKEAGPKRLKPLPAPPSKPTPANPETLDSSWDKRLGGGKLSPDMTIDLHGMRREEARSYLYHTISVAEARGHRVILVITGKGGIPSPSPYDLMNGQYGRGAIKTDVPRWLGESDLSRRIAAVRKAHQRHGGSGALYLILKRKR